MVLLEEVVRRHLNPKGRVHARTYAELLYDVLESLYYGKATDNAIATTSGSNHTNLQPRVEVFFGIVVPDIGPTISSSTVPSAAKLFKHFQQLWLAVECPNPDDADLQREVYRRIVRLYLRMRQKQFRKACEERHSNAFEKFASRFRTAVKHEGAQKAKAHGLDINEKLLSELSAADAYSALHLASSVTSQSFLQLKTKDAHELLHYAVATVDHPAGVYPLKAGAKLEEHAKHLKGVILKRADVTKLHDWTNISAALVGEKKKREAVIRLQRAATASRANNHTENGPGVHEESASASAAAAASGSGTHQHLQLTQALPLAAWLQLARVMPTTATVPQQQATTSARHHADGPHDTLAGATGASNRN